ncbi:MAG: oxidoreductase [Cyclobacteriaceae bacterium]|nr:MAG: oxidoreductase [Cyclobacteriaceae bacterium]
MKTRKLGDSDLELTVIGLGTWAQGGAGWKFGWGPQDDQQSIEAIHQAIDSGINWIDTAAVYGLGHAEEVLGKALKGISQRPIIATKCARNWDKEGNIVKIQTKESIRQEVENSLKRLQIDTIDLYQVHWPEPDEQIEEGWETMTRLAEEGKVRYIGVSNYSVAQLERISGIQKPVSLQPPYSMITRKFEEELLPYCENNNIGVVCYSPMYKGLLTGKMTRERLAGLAENDHRRNDPNFNEPKLTRNLSLVEQLKPIAKDLDITLAQLSIAWTLRWPAVTSAIVGARSARQLEETIEAGRITLTVETIEKIQKAIDAVAAESSAS